MQEDHTNQKLISESTKVKSHLCNLYQNHYPAFPYVFQVVHCDVAYSIYIWPNNVYYYFYIFLLQRNFAEHLVSSRLFWRPYSKSN